AETWENPQDREQTGVHVVSDAVKSSVEDTPRWSAESAIKSIKTFTR
ncbi:unnamed protein product, partial [Tenebrio molitor]